MVQIIKCLPELILVYRILKGEKQNMRNKINPSEHQEQVFLFEWVFYNKSKYPELNIIYAIPNGGKRNIGTARKLKAEGVKSGIPDIHLPVARNNYIGLWIEMKFAKNKLTENQKKVICQLENNGHKVVVCYGWFEASQRIEEYLNGGT